MMPNIRIPFLCLALALGCSAGSAPSDAVAQDERVPLGVDFAGCREVANVGLMPTANARPLVPPQFTLAGDDVNTPFVVRSVHCDSVSVDGDPASPGNLIQIGLVITAPEDDGANINNYMLYYDTTDGELSGRLRGMGVPATEAARLSESLTLNPDGSGQYQFVVPAPFEPQLVFAGPVGAPSAPFPFVANWWFTSKGQTIKMHSSFPGLIYAGNSVTLTVPDGSALAGLIGSTTVSSWPALALFDTFPAAHMDVIVE
jgi:hypothetical protein